MQATQHKTMKNKQNFVARALRVQRRSPLEASELTRPVSGWQVREIEETGEIEAKWQAKWQERAHRAQSLGDWGTMRASTHFFTTTKRSDG